MAQAFITLGSKTSHGGVVSECDSSFVIYGVGVHLNGMKHFCPKCKTLTTALAASQSTLVKGRAIVIAGDQAACGAIFLPNQHLMVSAQ